MGSGLNQNYITMLELHSVYTRDELCIAFVRFVNAHNLSQEELKDTDYLRDIYANFIEDL